MKVLIADDSELLRNHLKKLLTFVETITEINETGTVHATIEALETRNPEVLILDIQMPDGNGFEVLKRLQVFDKRPFTIVYTNFPSKFNKKKSFRMGADFFFDKTNEFEALIEILKQIKRR
jgi:DNA-binding NarL/FixJ family response regulator